MKEIPISDRLPELDVAIEAVVNASQEILKIYKGKFDSETKNDDSPITIADLKSNEIIKSVLSQTNHTILSEEDKDDKNRLSETAVWIIDPLDGTSDFIDKTGEFTIMISLVKNSKPILGVIGWPTGDTIFAAQKEKGAYRYKKDSWKKISVSDETNLARCRTVGSRHHLSDKEKSFIAKLGITDFTSIGSSLKVAKISSGEAEAYITTTNKMKEWDSAASYCLVHEAGGKMTDMNGNDLSYNREDVYHKNGILVTNGKIHEKIVEEFKKL